MSDVGLDLFAAVRTVLTSDVTVAAHVGDRVFSSWDNQTAQPPFIRMNIPRETLHEMDGAGEGSETSINVHVFTSEASPKISRQLASRIRTLLHHANLALAGSYLFDLEWRDTISTTDPDTPKLQMAVIRFLATSTLK